MIKTSFDFISSLYKPMQHVGGDFFDLVSFDDSDNVGIFLSDVSGHGVTAACINSMIQTIILNAGKRRRDPARLISYINKVLQNQTGGNFVTIFYGIYNPTERSILYSNAGHNPPFVISRNAIRELSGGKSAPAAILPNRQLARINKCYYNHKTYLPPQSKLLLYTDGLVEAQSGKNNTSFQEAELDQWIMEYKNLSASNFKNKLYSALIQFHGSESFDDDICLICVDIL
jgi:sigma-B regulation protein RsbU (phosphoserine phosphatase)